MDPRYFDYNASTPLDPEVQVAMTTALVKYSGNPSSAHGWGREARAAIDSARERVAGALNCPPDRIIFTAGGSEANSLAILGLLLARIRRGKKPGHFLLGSTEHESIVRSAEFCRDFGATVDFIPCDGLGTIHPGQVEPLLREETGLVSIMHANNETGTIQPLKKIHALLSKRGIPLHTDMVQSFGKLPMDFKTPPFHLSSLSAHKFFGPKGGGILFRHPDIPLSALIQGSQENYFRGGTENPALALGIALALEQAVLEREHRIAHCLKLRIALLESLKSRGIPFHLNGPDPLKGEPGLVNTLNLSFPEVHGEALMVALDMEGFMVSNGSACSSGKVRSSHVLTAMGLEKGLVQGAVRISLGKFNTLDSVEQLAEAIGGATKRLRSVGGG